MPLETIEELQSGFIARTKINAAIDEVNRLTTAVDALETAVDALETATAIGYAEHDVDGHYFASATDRRIYVTANNTTGHLYFIPAASVPAGTRIDVANQRATNITIKADTGTSDSILGAIQANTGRGRSWISNGVDEWVGITN